MKKKSLKRFVELHEENVRLVKQKDILMELIGKIKHFAPQLCDDYLNEVSKYG